MADDELRGTIDSLRQANAAEHEKTRRHIDVSMAAMTHELKIIAEKLRRLDEKVDRRFDVLEEKLDRSITSFRKREVRSSALENP